MRIPFFWMTERAGGTVTGPTQERLPRRTVIAIAVEVVVIVTVVLVVLVATS